MAIWTEEVTTVGHFGWWITFVSRFIWSGGAGVMLEPCLKLDQDFSWQWFAVYIPGCAIFCTLVCNLSIESLGYEPG